MTYKFKKKLGHIHWAATPLYFPGYYNTMSFGLWRAICSKIRSKNERGMLFPERKKKNMKS